MYGSNGYNTNCCCCGPQGPQGPQGIQGATGPQGPPFVGEYASFSKSSSMTISAINEGITFDDVSGISTSGISRNGTIINITTPGIYQLHYTINVPTDKFLTTTISLQMNNNNIEGTVIFIDKVAENPYSATGQKIFPVTPPGTTLRISSSNIFSMTSPNATLASINIIQIQTLPNG